MITTIPIDCILEILPYLDENDLFELSCLSHKLFEIVKFQIKKSNNRRNGYLRIVESEYGLSFQHKYVNADINFCYTLINCPWGGPPKGKRFTFTNEMEPDYEKFLLQERHFVTPRLNVDSEFLACLDKLQEQHSWNQLTLKNIRVDSDFMTYLEDTVQEFDILGLIGVKIEENCRKRFYQYVSKLRLSYFYIRNSESALQEFNINNFVENFFRETKCVKGGCFYIDSPAHITQECRFFPSKSSAVGYLSSCWYINNMSLTIPAVTTHHPM